MIVSVMPVVSNVSRKKFLLVLTLFAIGTIFFKPIQQNRRQLFASEVVAQGVRNLVDVSCR